MSPHHPHHPSPSARPSIQDTKRRKSLRDMEVPPNTHNILDDLPDDWKPTIVTYDDEVDVDELIKGRNGGGGDEEENVLFPNQHHTTATKVVRRHADARLRWENITLTVHNKKNQSTTILDNVWGESPQGEISAIMGPSGSGKTSLLNVLSGRMSNATQNVTVEADSVTWNGTKLNVTDLATRQTIAFVAQDDSLPVSSTPREAILFSARLRLAKELTLAQLHKITDKMLRQLHLESCADTFVGGALLKGISGGERKRTSVAVELVTRPRLVFLDEPTSGLDSFNALELVQVLKQVASTGSAVMLTIHQPSSEIWNLFDRLTLLKEGRVMYEGRRSGVPDKFKACGYPLPNNYNPADWVMFCAQSVDTDTLERAGFFPVNDFSTHGKVKPIAGSHGLDALDNTITNNNNNGDEEEADNEEGGRSSHSNGGVSKLMASTTPEKRVGFVTQTSWLFQREIQNFRRNTHPLRTRTVMTLMISLLCGCLFWQSAKEDYSENYVVLQTAFAALLLALMANIFSTTLPALVAFPEERPVFLREYSAGCYSVHAYFVSRFTMEVVVTAVQVTISTLITYFMVGFQQSFGLFWLVIYAMALTSTALGVMIGSTASDPTVAIELLPAVFMPQILFSGFFIPKELVPGWLAWLTYVFPLSYAMRLVLIYEFEPCADDGGATCARLLQNTDSNPDDAWWYWLILVAQFAVCRLLALVVLHRKAKTFY